MRRTEPFQEAHWFAMGILDAYFPLGQLMLPGKVLVQSRFPSQRSLYAK